MVICEVLILEDRDDIIVPNIPVDLIVPPFVLVRRGPRSNERSLLFEPVSVWNLTLNVREWRQTVTYNDPAIVTYRCRSIFAIVCIYTAESELPYLRAHTLVAFYTGWI